ncbi:carbamoyltransferase HypF [Tolypothrix sp. LEGE 11397]|uniref:carbamoyltransferase HypF n=1 Tax=unclassified Tolypothrix TaxID=2649714 RepID=UPI000B5EC80F|nr:MULTISPECIES: carbamoyltransferase HypF [unclassified Tolypothrix]MBE9080789.1 carbamoyltransferase HypF [Tolypothrix sp. LEGE 11397]UYD29651.1 carbamoyltransferase HypF [Tolypothrix sp. PCC 7712]UYD34433.1 carbamoyltransferase HypF [Tolypothrix sp. PCC 7601]BAY89021.1 (NiFe) hydrogenase maturation protein HypF [Microchaete diplosiphon NIES-3275]
MATEEIRVRGTVQGVGFRPTVYRIAKACGLRGDVCNDGQGVLIRLSGSEAALAEFIAKLQQECPPLAKIAEIIRTPLIEELHFDDFAIAHSVTNKVKTAISPDAAICPQCQQEIFDPFSRYFRYPFTNCTHCGPRLSIIRAIPYDRCNTSMSAFTMCPQCEQEYHDIENRRFHAQPVACHICGPTAWLERADGKSVTASMFSMLDDVDAVCTLLQKGEIVAIKGLSGIHLACDATQEATVQKLRQRKNRYHKPFALMARDIDIIAQYCTISPQEQELLRSPAAPIVLLRRKGLGIGDWGQINSKFKIQNSKLNNSWGLGIGEQKLNQKSSIQNPKSVLKSLLNGGEPPHATFRKIQNSIAPSVAPGQNRLGFMLPYTPLHHLILKRMNRPIVLTSGNLSDEPQCIDNEVAKEKLSKIADYFLLHNREIVNRADDSVVRVVGEKLQIIRRARGYAPAPINLPPGFDNIPQILAMGSELKNTFCLLREGQAILSQHLGDLENAAAFDAYQDTLNLYLNLFEHQPEVIAIDKHPEYLSTKLGKELAAANHLPIYPIQHHHAHIAACMAENGLPLDASPVLGIALDGLGYGEDGTLWGGEFLLADYRKFQRLAALKPIAMIGGAQAIYQPWRNTYAHLIAADSWENLKKNYGDLEILKFLEEKPLKVLNQLIEKGINSPQASSAGRLFDAVAAALGICREECSYEGQAAIAMEALIDEHSLNHPKENPNYPFNFSFFDNIYCIDPSPMWSALLKDLQNQISQGIIATKFHQSLAKTIAQMVKYLTQEHVINQVVLTGGVFQNCILLEQVTRDLQTLGITVLTHSLVPVNDGGISLGQAVIAAAQLSA